MAGKKSTGRVTPKKVNKPVSTAKQWKGANAPSELVVPSGNVCMVRRPGLDTFIARGLVPNSLMPLLSLAAEGKADDSTVDQHMKDIAANPEKIKEMLGLVDAVTVNCVADPQVWAVPVWTLADLAEELCMSDDIGQPKPVDHRDPDRLYVDEIDVEDKMFIFNWAVGGDRSIDRFRAEQAQRVVTLLDGADVAGDTELTAGA